MLVLNQEEAEKEEYYITLHPGYFPTKKSFNLGMITNWFKKNGQSRRYTLEQIFKFTSEGRCFIPSNVQLEKGTYTFVSSNLIFIDIDDDDKKTNPEKLLIELQDVCAGLFYTSSHSETKNRYRLVFVLDEYIRDIRVYEAIFEAIVVVLKELGVPVDEAIKTPLQRIRTANKGYRINNLDAKFSVKQLKANIELQQERMKQAKLKKLEAISKRQENLIYTVEELKARAEKIGYVEDIDEWFKLGYSLKSYVEEGSIDDLEGYEVFSILCGGNDETKVWQGFKPNQMTIGTFIHFSNNAGFKRTFKYYHAIASSQFSLPIERVKFMKYMPISYSKELLEREEKILVKSPTGSGKTHSFINAAKQLAEELIKQKQTRFFILTVPTRAITDQVANDNHILAVRGETKDIYENIRRYVYSGKRVFVCTYDIATVLYAILKTIKPLASFCLIVDEVHQLVHSYGFRKEAVEEVRSLVDKVKSFIGLSGTPDDVLRDMFDSEVHVQTKYEKAPCTMWGVITYNKTIEEEPMLFQLLKQKAEHGKKLLVFIQNKEMIERIKRQLKKIGIRVASITANEKQTSLTYRTLVRESKFDDAQIILTTSLSSDGININNETIEYECIVVASQRSPMFNVDQVRQCANRFRKPYRAFYIYMQKPKRKSNYLYNIEAAYKHEQNLANNIVDLINSEFSELNSRKLYKTGQLEKYIGIQFDEEERAKYNDLKLRFNVSNEKTKFYTIYRESFIQALAVLMGFQALQSIDVSAFIEKNRIDLSMVVDEIEHLKLVAKMEKEEKQKRIAEIYTQNVHSAFVQGDEEVLNLFKKAVITEHYNCLEEIANKLDFKLSLKIVQQVTNRRNIHAYKDRIQALINIQYYRSINRLTATKEAYEDIKQYLGKRLTKENIYILIEEVSKKYKRSKKVNVRHIVNNYFYHEANRTNKERFTILHELRIENVAEMFGINESDVQKTMQLFSEKEANNLVEIIMKKGDVSFPTLF